MKEDYIWNDRTKRYVLRKNKIGRQLEENYGREKYIENMKNKSPDDYEPIYFEPFQKWTDFELQTSVFMGNHFYKAKDLFDYVNCNKKSKQIRDPITGKDFLLSDIKIIFKKNFEIYKGVETFKFDKKNIKVDNEFIPSAQPLLPDKSRWGFMRMSLKFNPKKYDKLEKHNVLLGYVPLYINVQPLAFDEIPALDSASTSEAIISKISVLVEEGKLFDFSDTNEIIGVKNIVSLLKEPKDWLTYGYKHFKMIDVFTRKSPYFQLLNELELLESI